MIRVGETDRRHGRKNDRETTEMTRSRSRKNAVRTRALQALAGTTRRFHPRGINRLLRRIYDPELRQADHLETVIKYDRTLRIHVNTSDFLEWLVFFYGYHEPEVAREIDRSFRTGFVAFDIGANAGCHTLLMAARSGPSGQIFAAEPNPGARRRLEENIRLNRLENIVSLPCAFSDRAGRVKLFVPVAGTANRGVASIYPGNVNYRKETVVVEVRTLDGEVSGRGLERLDFIKVDTEGNELKVLRGGRESLRRYRPEVIFEYDRRAWQMAGADFREAVRFFAGLGYSLFLIGRRSLLPPPDPLPPMANFLARPHSG